MYLCVTKCIYVYLMHIHPDAYSSLQRQEESIRFPGAGVTVGCKAVSMGAGNWTVL